MAVKVQSTIEPYNNSYMVTNAKHVGVGEPGQEKPLDEVLRDLPGGDVSCEIPSFDLTALGMPTIDRGGETKLLETDTAEIIAALDKGVVKFTVALNFSSRDVQHDIVMNAVKTNGNYFCAYTFNWYDETFVFTLDISVGLITGYLQLVTMGEQEESNPSYSITIDSELSLTSENPVQNKVIAQGFQAFGEMAEEFNERLTTLEQSGGVGGGSGVSSWNDLTDKPFGENEDGTVKQLDNKYLAVLDHKAGKYTEFLPSTTSTTEFLGIAFGMFPPMDGAAYAAWQENTAPITVEYDGEEYVCEVLSAIDGAGEVTKYIGDGSSMGVAGNGEPFAIIADNDTWLIYSTRDTSPTEHTVRIYQNVPGKWLLKEECLPFDAISAYIDNYIDEALGGDY